MYYIGVGNGNLVFLPGKSYGQRCLAGYSPWGRKELDMAEYTYTHLYNTVWYHAVISFLHMISEPNFWDVSHMFNYSCTCYIYSVFFGASSQRQKALWRQEPHLIYVLLSHKASHVAKFSLNICWNKSYLAKFHGLKWHTSIFRVFLLPVGLCRINVLICIYASIPTRYMITKVLPWASFCKSGFSSASNLIFPLISSVTWASHFISLSFILINWDNNNAFSMNCFQIIY